MLSSEDKLLISNLWK